jgi:hypothetical protein
MASRTGRARTQLQNAELGLVLLIKTYNVKAELSCLHLKIEVSPNLIEQYSPSNLQVMLNELAREILAAVEQAGSSLNAIPVQPGYQH